MLFKRNLFLLLGRILGLLSMLVIVPIFVLLDNKLIALLILTPNLLYELYINITLLFKPGVIYDKKQLLFIDKRLSLKKLNMQLIHPELIEIENKSVTIAATTFNKNEFTKTSWLQFVELMQQFKNKQQHHNN